MSRPYTNLSKPSDLLPILAQIGAQTKALKEISESCKAWYSSKRRARSQITELVNKLTSLFKLVDPQDLYSRTHVLSEAMQVVHAAYYHSSQDPQEKAEIWTNRSLILMGSWKAFIDGLSNKIKIIDLIQYDSVHPHEIDPPAQPAPVIVAPSPVVEAPARKIPSVSWFESIKAWFQNFLGHFTWKSAAISKDKDSVQSSNASCHSSDSCIEVNQNLSYVTRLFSPGFLKKHTESKSQHQVLPKVPHEPGMAIRKYSAVKTHH